MAAKGKEVPSISATAKDLFKNQSFSGFYRDIDSNIARAMVLNGTKMGVYDQAKSYVVETTGLAKTSLVTAVFFMTVTVSPFDMIRTRLMNQPADAKIYNNALDCMMKIARRRAADLLAWFHAYLVAVCAHHHLAVDYFRAATWNDGYEGAVVERGMSCRFFAQNSCISHIATSE